MKTQYYTASSLDGFIADPNDSLDWLFPLGDVSETSYPAFIREVGALAMGSVTYEWMLRHVIGADPPQPWPYQLPAWVFTSRTLPEIPGVDIRFVRGDVRPVHQAMVSAAAGKTPFSGMSPILGIENTRTATRSLVAVQRLGRKCECSIVRPPA